MKRGGLRISKGKNYDQQQRDAACVACVGSGYYDDLDRRGRPIKCGSCSGTGRA
jgi:hypothetical protein